MSVRIVVLIFITIGIAALCAAQQPLLSPRDSAKIIVLGKKISVNYGSPSMRGRKIMGELVPFNKVWRTGANEATAFTSEVDVKIGGIILPKGSYTLYTLPSSKQWKLIINKQTGQWGTVYNAELDFARIAMKKKILKQPVEKLLMTLKKNGNDTVLLVLEWEYTSLSVPMKLIHERPLGDFERKEKK